MLTLQFIFIIVISIIIIIIVVVVILFIYLFIYFHSIAYPVWTFICGDILKAGNASTGCNVEDS